MKRNTGQSILTAVIFFVFISLAFLIGIANPTVRDASDVRALYRSKRSFYTAESGQEDVIYRIRHAKVYENQEDLAIDDATASTVVTDDVPNSAKDVSTTGNFNNHIRKSKTRLVKGDQVSFNYGIQAGGGGLLMRNSSLVNGNVYANGTVHGDNSNLIKGSVVSAGVAGLIEGSHATSSAYAHTIKDSNIEKDAYYQTLTNTVVLGTRYPGSSDRPTVPMPIDDDTIDGWEQAAVPGGTISSPCPYKITSDTTLGPVKINCDLQISGSPVITLLGDVWVSGNISFKNSPTIKIDPSFGARGLSIIADNQSDRLNSSKITTSNSPTFQGSGTPGSLVILVSRNSSDENGGTGVAIDYDNSAGTDVLLYSLHGRVLIRNQAQLKSLSAYKLELLNNTQVVYDSGVASTLFDSGPGGSWDIMSWQEIQ